ncbi:MAG: HEAT repeat domain-containing protein [Candidatus Thorarchaeota archaeon]
MIEYDVVAGHCGQEHLHIPIQGHKIRDLCLSLEIELLNAIGKSDYNASSNALEKSLFEGNIDKTSNTLRKMIDTKPNLRIRDHVAFFLSIEPIYCSLEIPSYDLLSMVNCSEDRYHAAYEIFELVEKLVDSKDPKFNQRTFRIEEAAASAYAIMAPEVLRQRMQEMDDCIVPFAKPPAWRRGKDSDRYHIGMLLNTKYGESIIQSLSGFNIRPIVGESIWKAIEAALLEVGFNPEAMCREITFDEWYDYVKSLEKFPPNKLYPNVEPRLAREIRLLRELFETEEAIKMRLSDSSPEGKRLLRRSILDLRNLQTRHFNNELLQIISQGSVLEHLELILEVLIQTQDPRIENIMSDFLESEEAEIRKCGARGLAKLHALASPLSTGEPAYLESIAISELLAASQSVAIRSRSCRIAISFLSRSKSLAVKKDLVKILVQLHDSETERIFFELLSDSNKEVGMEVLFQIRKLPAHLVKDLLTQALSNSHEEIVARAEELALELGDFDA